MTIPKIEDARALGKRGRLRSVMIFFVTEEGQLGYASYGQTAPLCKATRKVADSIFDHLEAGVFDITSLRP